MTERNGHCLCRAVSFRLTAEPITTRVCWCRHCQHLAANGSVNALVPTDALEISGELSEFTSTADSGNQISRRFCPRCGSHLFGNSSARPEFTVIRVGNFDDPSSVHPVMNIWAASAPNWACLDAALERVEEQASPPPGDAAQADIPPGTRR
ncbi:MAG: GFA family protein [Candidatus Accumulibacter sp.]|nr:GFA family protein [Accumulibacter sp.]